MALDLATLYLSPRKNKVKYEQSTCMTVNAKKSACLRFGPRYKNACSSVMVCGLPVNWVTSARYLGVYLELSLIHI